MRVMQVAKYSLLCLVLLLALGLGSARAGDTSAEEPGLSALPVLAEQWWTENPYRGDVRVAAIGQTLFAAHCQRCHGENASGRGPAPDLRVLGRYCMRIADGELHARCMRDADDYFRRSVQFGKVRMGVVHMPPWKEVLSEEAIWALRTYVGTRGQ